MLLVKSYLKFSEIHGVGCFSAEDIKQGQIVWKLDPKLDVTFSDEELQSFEPAVKQFMQMYAYGQMENGKKSHILCGDHARHMNHSSDPNLIEAGDGNAYNIAARDIKAGEELTCDYLAFDTDAKHKLSP